MFLSSSVQMKILSILEKAVGIRPAALSLVTNHSLTTWTLMSAKADEDEEATSRFLSILEATWRSIMDLWKKDQTSDLEKVITKLSEDTLINCQSMLTNIK